MDRENLFIIQNVDNYYIFSWTKSHNSEIAWGEIFKIESHHTFITHKVLKKTYTVCWNYTWVIVRYVKKLFILLWTKFLYSAIAKVKIRKIQRQCVFIYHKVLIEETKNIINHVKKCMFYLFVSFFLNFFYNIVQ